MSGSVPERLEELHRTLNVALAVLGARRPWERRRSYLALAATLRRCRSLALSLIRSLTPEAAPVGFAPALIAESVSVSDLAHALAAAGLTLRHDASWEVLVIAPVQESPLLFPWPPTWTARSEP